MMRGTLIALVLLCAAEARAQETRWYGGTNILVDAASLGLLAGGIGAQSAPPAIVGSLGYALGSPIVHWSHGNVGRGFASLGLRLGLPFVTGAVGAAVAGGCSDCDVPPAFGGAIIGAGVGALAAMIIDDVALAREEVPPGESRLGFGFTGRSVAFAMRF